MTPTLQWRRPGWRTLAWSLTLVLIGAALGFGLNAVSPVGINLHIALGLDDAPSAGAGQAQTPAAGVKP
jgi:hypothetical protein